MVVIKSGLLTISISQLPLKQKDYNILMKILVVEDDQKIASNIKKGLELNNHTVDLSFNGETGLDMALSEDYDLIILDHMLPKLSGLEVCESLREKKSQTPILMLTARNEIDDRVTGLNAGADDYLGKPFDFAELLARVSALGRRPKQKLNHILNINSLNVNTDSFSVERKGRNIKLSKKEYTLLEFLLRNKEQIFSKEQLLEKLWSFESDVLPNTVQVYIGYLRKKIDEAFPKEKRLIHTIRGFGYTIRE